VRSENNTANGIDLDEFGNPSLIRPSGF